MAFGAGRLAAALAELDPAWPEARFCVALSGGIDSVALLHALHGLREAGRIRGLRALHVDHGLQAGSRGFAERCRDLCRRLAVPFEIADLRLAVPPGASVEAHARDARYAAIAERLRAGEWLLTAHHRDDQLETLLIQLMRGAGVPGLAAMPARARLGAGLHGRPLLGVERAEIDAYAACHGLVFEHDPMNDAPRFDRAWLRREILPPLRSRWPGVAATVARSAGHMAQAARLLAELAAEDATGMVDGGRLSVAALRRLSRDRQTNVLRWWIQERGLSPPPAARLRSIMNELLTARADAEPSVRWAGAELRRYRGRLYAMLPLTESPSAGWTLGPAPPSAVALGAGLGRFGLVATPGGGLDAGACGVIEIRFRVGGESLRPHADRPRKRLKQLCQEAGIVPWMRSRLPLVFIGDRLAAVADLWIDSELTVPAGRPAYTPVWSERPPLF
jgi:tRNA(Ile)-lysidine synthase